MKYSKQRFWTKEEIKTLLDLWSTKTVEEISATLNRPNSSIIGMCAEIRKAGYNLPKKKKTNYRQLLVKEVLVEQGLIR